MTVIAYDQPLRRRARALRRAAAMAAQPALRRRGIVLPTYWWDGHPNFGDDLTPWLLPRLGIAPIHREPQEARLVGVGSILEFLPQDWSGAVWGSGLMEDHRHELPHATVLAVRGHLTAERIGAPPTCAFGDPGILVSRFLPAPLPRWDVALVPHGHHRAHHDFLALAAGNTSVRVVNVHQGAGRAARQIASSRAVVTTSLHGLVIADAYGIPAVWTMLEPALGGGDFKFRDYESVMTPGRSRFVPFSSGVPLADLVRAAWAAPRDVVVERGDALVRALEPLREGVGITSFPRGLLNVLRKARHR